MSKSPLLASILTALTACGTTEQGTACIIVPAEQMVCAPPESLDQSQLFVPDRCGWDVVEVNGPGKRGVTTGQGGNLETCCYPAEIEETEPGCVIGRPFVVGGMELRAPACAQSSLAGDADVARASAWAAAGVAEHASVAAFGRLALELLRFAAPLELVRAVHAAALDEIAHAEACFRLAERYGGAKVVPGQFPF